MEKEMIIWYIIAGVVLVAVFFNLIEYLFATRHRQHAKNHSAVIEMMKDKEMFFIPGDNQYEDHYDDFDDL